MSEQAMETAADTDARPSPWVNKPSPVQARVLRMMVRWPGTSLRRERTGCQVERPDGLYKRGRDEYDEYQRDLGKLETGLVGKVRTPTTLAMERVGWLQRREQKWAASHPEFDLTELGRVAVRILEPDDFEDRPRPRVEVVPAAVMLDAIEARWNREDGWVWFREWQPGEWDQTGHRRLDAAAINRFGGNDYERMAFEIKRSRSDFLGELAHPEKRQPALQFSNRYWFVTPEGMVKPEEVPAEAGLAWISPDGAVHIKRKAPRREASGPTWGLIGAILRSLADRIAEQPRESAQEREHGEDVGD